MFVGQWNQRHYFFPLFILLMWWIKKLVFLILTQLYIPESISIWSWFIMFHEVFFELEILHWFCHKHQYCYSLHHYCYSLIVHQNISSFNSLCRHLNHICMTGKFSRGYIRQDQKRAISMANTFTFLVFNQMFCSLAY